MCNARYLANNRQMIMVPGLVRRWLLLVLRFVSDYLKSPFRSKRLGLPVWKDRIGQYNTAGNRKIITVPCAHTLQTHPCPLFALMIVTVT